jgi:hypothetical protein
MEGVAPSTAATLPPRAPIVPWGGATSAVPHALLQWWSLLLQSFGPCGPTQCHQCWEPQQQRFWIRAPSSASEWPVPSRPCMQATRPGIEGT